VTTRESGRTRHVNGGTTVDQVDYDDYSIMDKVGVALGYVGFGRTEAQDRAHSRGIWELRIVDLDDGRRHPWTADLRPQRLNLVVQNGRVVEATFG
jgi:hypothetical protein